jgi:preprotein translocase subunit Sec61beta
MAVKKGKKKDGSGIQQAAGLIRYFDEESEDAWHFTKGQIYAVCILLSAGIYLANHGVVDWFFGIF